jgi:hypothetical protein
LELVRRKLVKACLILRSNADVGRSWKEDVLEIGKQIPSLDLRNTLEVLQQYITGLERHARVTESLLDRLSGTSKLVRQVESCRIAGLTDIALPNIGVQE